MTNKEFLLSVVIPIYNEQENISDLIFELKKFLQNIQKEIIFVNDGSNDNSLFVLKKFANEDQTIKIIDLSKNFGKEIALSVGIIQAKGDCVISIDADLQHPVELIPSFIEKWQKGAEVVVGVRSKNNSIPFLKRVFSKSYYKVINSISKTPIKSDATDFRLIDKKVANEFKRFTEINRITRGLIDWLGFKREYIEFEVKPRKNGKAGYSYYKLFRLALNSFISHSLFPLRVIGYVGVIVTMLSGSLGLYILITRFILKITFFSGPFMSVVFNTFLVGLVLVSQGLIALYIANIHQETINRPLYIIKEKVNI